MNLTQGEASLMAIALSSLTMALRKQTGPKGSIDDEKMHKAIALTDRINKWQKANPEGFPRDALAASTILRLMEECIQQMESPPPQ